VTTTINALKILALTDNVLTLKSLVTTKTHVPMTAVMLLKDVSLLQNKSEIQTCAPSELVMLLKESLIPQETVMMETNALSTTVMQKRDANLFLNLSLKTVLQKLQDVKETFNA